MRHRDGQCRQDAKDFCELGPGEYRQLAARKGTGASSTIMRLKTTMVGGKSVGRLSNGFMFVPLGMAGAAGHGEQDRRRVINAPGADGVQFQGR